jgi:hypothetical protein
MAGEAEALMRPHRIGLFSYKITGTSETPQVACHRIIGGWARAPFGVTGWGKNEIPML